MKPSIRHGEAALAAVAIQGVIRDAGLLRFARNDEARGAGAIP
jgi:hypothetical protein